MSTLDPDLQPREPDASLAELITRLTSQTSSLVRQEIDLAKVEIKDDVRKAGAAGGMFGGAAYAAHMAMIAIVMFAGFGLGALFDGRAWLGFLIVALVFLPVAAVLAAQGKKKMDRATPPAEQTRESIQDTAQYLKERM